MKKAIVLVFAALLLAASLPAQASARHTLPHRVSALEAKVNGLQRKVNRLHAFAHNCLARDWAPIGWYGDERAGAGYVFDNDGAGPATPFFTSALDIAASPQETAFYVATLDPGCLPRVAAAAAALRREAWALGGTRRAARALR